ncbi:unnamed protein product [Leuciscus chuanchicus]
MTRDFLTQRPAARRLKVAKVFGPTTSRVQKSAHVKHDRSDDTLQRRSERKIQSESRSQCERVSNPSPADDGTRLWIEFESLYRRTRDADEPDHPFEKLFVLLLFLSPRNLIQPSEDVKRDASSSHAQ